MSKGSVTITRDNITLELGNGTKSTHTIPEIEKIYCLLVGSDVLSNDSICYLFVYRSDLWLIPELTHGVSGLKPHLQALNDSGRVVIATLDHLPYAWRSVLHILPGLEANLSILKSSELDKIKNELSIVGSMKLEDIL